MDAVVIVNNEIILDFKRLGKSFGDYGNDSNNGFNKSKFYLYKNKEYVQFKDPSLTITKDKRKMRGFRIKGNLRKWWFGKSSIQDFNLITFCQCIDYIEKKLGIPKNKLRNSAVIYLEIGGNVKLAKKYEHIIPAMVNFPRLNFGGVATETRTFRSITREIIAYNKLKEMFDHKIINKRVYEVLSKNIFVMRFEIKLKTPSGSTVSREVKTVNNIIENWDVLISYWENEFYKIKLHTIQNLTIKSLGQNFTRRNFKDFCVALIAKEYGIETVFNIINTNCKKNPSEERKHVLEISAKYEEENTIDYVRNVYDGIAKKASIMKRAY